MASTLIEALDDLDSQMLLAYEDYATELVSTWETFDGNSGQMSIVKHHVIDLVYSHIKDAKRYWPYGATPDDYLKDILNAYDPEVMGRAFSDTIESSYESIVGLWAESMDAQHEHEFLMATIGSSAAPHSTMGRWD